MGDSRYVGRVGGLAVALGVGAAIAGWGSGIALAQDGTSPPGNQSPATSESAGTPAGNDPQTTPDRAGDDTGKTEGAERPVAPRTARHSERPRRTSAQQRTAAVVPPRSEPAQSNPAEILNSAYSDTAAADPEYTPTAPDAAPISETVLPAAPPVKPDFAGTVRTAKTVKATATGLFRPAAALSTDLPVVAPQLWTLAAFARRDMEARSSAVSVVSDVQTSANLAAVVPNSVTHTAPPTLFDRVAVAALRVIREVSKLLGVNLYGQLGKAMASSNPPFFVKFGLDVKRTEFEVAPGNVWKVWEFTPPEPSGKTVIAVHGGGFILEPIALHWIDYADMARRTGATVVVPIYPLATTERGAAVNIVPAMADFISARIAADGAENVSIYADSAGPNLVLGAIREVIQRGDPLPTRMVLISFTPDLSLSNPAAYEIDDPILDLDNLEFYASDNHWGDGLDPQNPMISPLFLEEEVLAALPPTTVYVGSLEFVLPDTLLFHERAAAAGATISTVVGVGQYHDWPIGGLPINSQAPKVRKDIFRQLGLIA